MKKTTKIQEKARSLTKRRPEHQFDAIVKLDKFTTATLPDRNTKNADKINQATFLYKSFLKLHDDVDQQRALFAKDHWNSKKRKPRVGDRLLANHCVAYGLRKLELDRRVISEIGSALQRALDKDLTAKEFRTGVEAAGSVRAYARRKGSTKIEVRVSEKFRTYLRKLAVKNEGQLPKFVVRAVRGKNKLTLQRVETLVTEEVHRRDKGSKS